MSCQSWIIILNQKKHLVSKNIFTIIGVGCGEGIEPYVLSLDKHHV